MTPDSQALPRQSTSLAKTALEMYRELAATETHPGFASEIVRAVDGIMAGRVVAGSTEALNVAEQIAVSELRDERDRLRKWIDTEGRNCPSADTIDAVLKGSGRVSSLDHARGEACRARRA